MFLLLFKVCRYVLISCYQDDCICVEACVQEGLWKETLGGRRWRWKEGVLQCNKYRRMNVICGG